MALSRCVRCGSHYFRRLGRGCPECSRLLARERDQQLLLFVPELVRPSHDREVVPWR